MRRLGEWTCGGKGTSLGGGRNWDGPVAPNPNNQGFSISGRPRPHWLTGPALAKLTEKEGSYP